MSKAEISKRSEELLSLVGLNSVTKQISGTTTVLFSTHILSDVERICDHAAFQKTEAQGALPASF